MRATQLRVRQANPRVSVLCASRPDYRSAMDVHSRQFSAVSLEMSRRGGPRHPAVQFVHTTSSPPLFGIISDCEAVCGGRRCENWYDRLSASLRRQITALFMKRNSAVCGRTEITAHQRSRDLRRTMGFAFAFIVTAYARFLTKSLTSAPSSSLFRHAQSPG